MKSETDIAFALLRAALEGDTPHSPLSSLQSKDWWNLFRLMQKNHVVALTAGVMAGLDVPREVKIPWLAEREKAVRWHRYQEEVLQKIVDTMQRHGITTLVLKGTRLAQYYPLPEMREFGDLDLFFYDRHAEADQVAMRYLGVEPDNHTHHHSKYSYRGVTVESHYDFLNLHYPRSNRSYDAMLKQHIGEPTYEVLYLLRHLAIHFMAERINLRDIVDWALTCRALEQQADWTTVHNVSMQYGMEAFASALCTIAYRRLGIAIPLSFTGDATKDADTIEHDIITPAPVPTSSLQRWLAGHWRRKLALGDSSASLIWSKLASHLTHNTKPNNTYYGHSH